MTIKYYLLPIVCVMGFLLPNQALALSSRVYCFYIPKDKLNLSPPQQIKSATWLKIENKKVEVAKKTTVFTLPEADFKKLFTECEQFIGNKGKMLEIKGSDASGFETLSSFYRIMVDYADDSKPLQKLDDAELLKQLGLTETGQEALLAVLLDKESKDDLKELVNSVEGSTGWKKIAHDVTSNRYVQTTLTVATVLAVAWFAPAYVAAGVDLLYPIVYQALFGAVPSTWSTAYWLFYYPGRMRAVAWAYNNSSVIISIGGSMLGLASHIVSEIANNIRTKGAQEKLKGSQIYDKISGS